MIEVDDAWRKRHLAARQQPRHDRSIVVAVGVRRAAGVRPGSRDTEGSALVLLPRVRADTPPGEWNRFAIRLVQDTVRVELNGEVVIEKAALTGLPGRGPILLGKRGGAIEFANVYVKDL
jgi:hypothetical protein